MTGPKILALAETMMLFPTEFFVMILLALMVSVWICDLVTAEIDKRLRVLRKKWQR